MQILILRDVDNTTKILIHANFLIGKRYRKKLFHCPFKLLQETDAVSFSSQLIPLHLNSNHVSYQSIKLRLNMLSMSIIASKWELVFTKRKLFQLKAVLQIRIRMDPHLKSPPGSARSYADPDPDPDPGGKKA